MSDNAQAPPVAPAVERRRTNLAIVGLAIGMLLSTLDQTIVATALPSVATDLGSLSSVTWVVSAYLLTTTASAPLYGKLSDIYGRRRMVLIALGIFITASALCGLAPSVGSLVALRVIQGLGGGGLLTLGSAAIAGLVPLHERGKALSYTGTVFAIGSVGGPLLGGVFTDYLNWRWVFYINIPIGLIGLLLIIRYFTAEHTPVRGAIDFLGSALLVSAVTCVMLVTVWGGRDYAWGSTQIIGLLAIGAVLIAVFVWWEHQAPNPVLPPHLFRAPAFRFAVPASLVLGMLLLGAVVFLPQFFQAVRGMSAATSGLALTPLMLGVCITMTLVGRRVTASGRYRPFPIIGASLTLVGFAALTQLDGSTPNWQMAVEMFVLGAGIGFQIQLLVLVMQNSAEPQDLGVASSTAMFCRSMGGAVGTALFSTILVRQLSDRLATSSAGALAPGASPDGLVRQAMTSNSSLPPAVRAAFSQAFADSIHVVFVWALPLAGLLLVLTILAPSVPLWTVEFLRKFKEDHEAKLAEARLQAPAES
ncbi:MDR family MFS transporter [Streptomyces sp. SPB162]|uniref:MDR family MFS transporter n=1 Tax=Streptomyces sp. SPB162 TaxID=2940560 RepID=UPI0024059C7A|nr:MDR family MFS transporter [Streptomyces sp. SPB162]MDF9817181.1 EmrB/QacA subfamily drug resistance transporter [Streptomyces sp. SPB162]